MFERLVSRFTSSENYLDVFLLSIFFTILSVLLVQHVLPFQVNGQDFAGIIVTLFLSLSVAYPFVQYLLEQEEREITERLRERRLLHRHANELKLYLSFFLGATIAFAFSRFIVPDSFYSIQCSVLRLLGRSITDQCAIIVQEQGATAGVQATGFVAATPGLAEIVMNNFWVFVSTFLLSFFLSSGIIFILAWNASVLGVWVGTVSMSMLNSAAFVPAITLLYLPHGIPEIGAYILAGLAGSLLSRESEELVFGGSDGGSSIVLRDVVILIFIGLAALMLGGIIEVL